MGNLEIRTVAKPARVLLPRAAFVEPSASLWMDLGYAELRAYVCLLILLCLVPNSAILCIV